MDLDIIYPLIVPSRYYGTSWDLPHQVFPNKDYILTWVFLGTERTMTYIKRDEFDKLNNYFQNWQLRAFENLRNLLGNEENFYTRYRVNEDDEKLSFIIFSNEDGIGSSRILLSYEFEQAFPEGYNVAMPDRSYGVVASKNISLAEQKILANIIVENYGCSGASMSKLVLKPSDFSLPKEWLRPIDNELSIWLIETILSFDQ